MTNAYGYTIVKGCCSCSFNQGSEERPHVDSPVRTTMCDYYGCSVTRSGKNNCQYYNMKPWLWTFNPNSCGKAAVKPKEFYDWLHSLSAATYLSITTATKFNVKGEAVPKYPNMWKAWIEETVEGTIFIKSHPEMR